MYNIDSKGALIYLGEKTSLIRYNIAKRKWVWFDAKNNLSIATSSSLFTSLLMGVQVVDFSGVEDDRCLEDGTIRKLKFTTCPLGKFTCNDGLCIDIDERCDKIAQCKDQSDEDDCKIVHMKSSYNKNLAPFSFDTEENRYRKQ